MGQELAVKINYVRRITNKSKKSNCNLQEHDKALTEHHKALTEHHNALTEHDNLFGRSNECFINNVLY